MLSFRLPVVEPTRRVLSLKRSELESSWQISLSDLEAAHNSRNNNNNNNMLRPLPTVKILARDICPR